VGDLDEPLGQAQASARLVARADLVFDSAGEATIPEQGCDEEHGCDERAGHEQRGGRAVTRAGQCCGGAL